MIMMGLSTTLCGQLGDEVGLFLFAIQIGVIVNAVVWTTHAK